MAASRTGMGTPADGNWNERPNCAATTAAPVAKFQFADDFVTLTPLSSVL
eukprot:COSAG01_NODE_2886_length_6891_cov_26.917780_2_plen_50_part_00